MATSALLGDKDPSYITLLDLPLEMLTGVCHQLDLQDLVCVSATCKRFRQGECELQTVELPTGSPAVTALRELAFFGGELAPHTRPIGCSESWVAYLARCARQRRCREAPPVAAGFQSSLFVDATGRLVACGKGAAMGHGESRPYYDPTPVAAMAEVRMRSVAASYYHHSLALSWDGKVYSSGSNFGGQLGHGDASARRVPAQVEGLEGVRDIAAAFGHSVAVTQSGAVFCSGRGFQPEAESLKPILVQGFDLGVRVRRVVAGGSEFFAIGQAGELFSWGRCTYGHLGHGDTQHLASPKRVEALWDVRMSSVSVGEFHALALAEDGLVYAWGRNTDGATLGNPHVESELQPKPVEVLLGVRVRSVAAAGNRSYALADTGELWAWGEDGNIATPLGHGEQMNCPLPKPIEALRGVNMDAVAAGDNHTLAVADDGSVYAWGTEAAASSGALGLDPSLQAAGRSVPMPQHVPVLRVTCGLSL
jgi:alpha-tubulin suppressor-like RCC1 family protein